MAGYPEKYGVVFNKLKEQGTLEDLTPKKKAPKDI
jgi:hypothetical protein